MPLNDLQTYYLTLSTLEKKLENENLTELQIYDINEKISAYKIMIENYHKHRKKEQLYSNIIFFGLFQVPE